jgi:hypothetical protein
LSGQGKKSWPVRATHFLSSAEGCGAKEITVGKRQSPRVESRDGRDKLRAYILLAATSCGGLISTCPSLCSICMSSYRGEKEDGSKRSHSGQVDTYWGRKIHLPFVVAAGCAQ